MSLVLASYTGSLSEALAIGAVLGLIGGVILFTVDQAAERIQRIVVGMLAGGFGMAVYQAFRVSNLLGSRLSRVDPAFRDVAYSEGWLFWNAVLRTLQMALLGGLFMIVSVAPARALQGALGGLGLGLVTGIISWAALQLLAAPIIPRVVFGMLALGVFLFLYDLQPFGHGD